MRVQILLATISALALTTDAWWRMECQGVLGVARMDPLISYGKPSQHAHSVSGSSGFSMTSTYDELVAGNCTSCTAKMDKSAYWHPAVYFKDAGTGKFELVTQTGGTLVYYMMHGDNIQPFPKGFRMIAGDNTRRTYTLGDAHADDPPHFRWASLGQTNQASLKQRAVGFNCLHYHSLPNEGTLNRHFLPDKSFIEANCPDGIRFELMFPSCWNGKDITSKNYQDHVAYPDEVNAGSCPPDFPVRLPSLMFEVIWQMAAFQGRDGEFVIANGNQDGFAYHGDFVMGWEGDSHERAVRECGAQDGSGESDKCGVFLPLQGPQEMGQCKMAIPADLASEDTVGPLKDLPGNVPIGGFSGKGPDIQGPPPGPPAQSSSARPSPSAAAPIDVPDQILQGQKTAPPPAPPAVTPPAAEAPPAVTPPVEEAPPATRMPGYSYEAVSTELKTAGKVVTEIVWEQAIQYVTEEVVSTATVTMARPAPVKARHAHMRRHAARHGGRL